MKDLLKDYLENKMILKNRPYLKEGDFVMSPKKSFYAKKIRRILWWQKILFNIGIDLMIIDAEIVNQL